MSWKSGQALRKRKYIVYVTRDEQGHLHKVPIPMHYAYVFVAAAVVGLFTLTGLAGSYTRMLLKTEHFNQVRSESDALRRDYQKLQSETHQKDMQVASLGSLASEVSALYGLRQSKLLTPKTVAPAVDSTDTSDTLSGDGYTASLDQFYALRTSALSGVAANALSAGLGSADTLTDWVRLADAPSLWPVMGRVTSSFGERTDPLGGEGEFHRGIDIAAGYGDAVRATADGVVQSAGMASGYGREIIVNHGHGMQTLYAHLSAITVAAGENVGRGQIIGYVGQSGRATGPHLHYEVRINDTPVNPHRYMRVTVQQMATSQEPAQLIGQ